MTDRDPHTDPSPDSHQAIDTAQPANTARFIHLMKHPLRFRLFLLTRLPSAFFSGLRIRAMDEQRCQITVPFTWFTKNPFRSTYFACLSMAAEMSTGALALAHSVKHTPPISMLVVKLEANYFKKAVGRTLFTCADGNAIRHTIQEAVATGEGRSIRAHSIGTNPTGETVAEFFVTWSFKLRSPSAGTK